MTDQDKILKIKSIIKDCEGVQSVLGTSEIDQKIKRTAIESSYDRIKDIILEDEDE